MDQVHGIVDWAARSSPWWTSGWRETWAWRRVASAERDRNWGSLCSLAGVGYVEGDVAKPRGCSPEHEWRRRGCVMEAKSDGCLSSVRRRSGARGTLGEKGNGVVKPVGGAHLV
jgi:hypothetical protein